MSSTTENPSVERPRGKPDSTRPPSKPDDILAIVSAREPWSPAVDMAIELAARWGSKLTGCYIEPSLRHSGHTHPEPSVLGMLLRAVDVAGGDRAAFVSHARRHGVVDVDWVVTHTGLAPTLRALGAWHDLAVIERDLVEGVHLFDMLSEAMSNSRLPCLLLPPQWNAPPSFGRVAIGWNGSIEATRAIHGALPFLQSADEVVMVVGGNGTGADESEAPPGFDPLDYLRHHHVALRSRPIRLSPREAGPALLKTVHDLDADLLVMGSYSHSQLRERILGGATRHVLEHATIPLLMAH